MDPDFSSNDRYDAPQGDRNSATDYREPMIERSVPVRINYFPGSFGTTLSPGVLYGPVYSTDPIQRPWYSNGMSVLHEGWHTRQQAQGWEFPQAAQIPSYASVYPPTHVQSGGYAPDGTFDTFGFPVIGVPAPETILPVALNTPQPSNLAQIDRGIKEFRVLTAIFSVPRGPFLPQATYRPLTEVDIKRYVDDVTLQHVLIFESAPRNEWGIALPDALACTPGVLKNPNDPVFEGVGPSVSIRLKWPGYRPWSRQIPTKNYKKPPSPITRQKLAKSIAKSIIKFMEKSAGHQIDEDADPNWRVGDVKFDDLMLVSLHHVSKGSWQPQIRLKNPRAPL